MLFHSKIVIAFILRHSCSLQDCFIVFSGKYIDTFNIIFVTWLVVHVFSACAEGAKLDGLMHPEVDMVADAGTQGLYASNVRRDIVRRYSRHVDMPKPIEVEVPCVIKEKVASFKLPILFPHQLFHWLRNTYQRKFEQAFSASKLQTFWGKVSF